MSSIANALSPSSVQRPPPNPSSIPREHTAHHIHQEVIAIWCDLTDPAEHSLRSIRRERIHHNIQTKSRLFTRFLSLSLLLVHSTPCATPTQLTTNHTIPHIATAVLRMYRACFPKAFTPFRVTRTISELTTSIRAYLTTPSFDTLHPSILISISNKDRLCLTDVHSTCQELSYSFLPPSPSLHAPPTKLPSFVDMNRLAANHMYRIAFPMPLSMKVWDEPTQSFQSGCFPLWMMLHSALYETKLCPHAVHRYVNWMSQFGGFSPRPPFT
mgnify:CR=1 FL=1